MLLKIHSQNKKWFQLQNEESGLTVNTPGDDLSVALGSPGLDQHQTAASCLHRFASQVHESAIYYVLLSAIEVFETQMSQRTKESRDGTASTSTRTVAASVRWNRIG